MVRAHCRTGDWLPVLFNLGGVGVRAATTAERRHHVHEATVILDASLCASGLLLLLLLLLHLRGLALDLTGTRQGAVHLTSQHRHDHVQLEVGQRLQGVGDGQDATLARQLELIGIDVFQGGDLSLSMTKSKTKTLFCELFTDTVRLCPSRYLF